MKQYAKIKPGSIIFQDFRSCKWPQCCLPNSEYEGEEYQYLTKNPEMVFEVEMRSNDYIVLTADGYGFQSPRGKYGNGSISVRSIDDLEILEDYDTSKDYIQSLEHELNFYKEQNEHLRKFNKIYKKKLDKIKEMLNEI